eukprot:1179271-Amphidinium_carterae.1
MTQVDSNDKVTRLRRECPHELCGPGVFMVLAAAYERLCETCDLLGASSVLRVGCLGQICHCV